MSHKTIAGALAAAQSKMGKALKQSQNPHFRSKYADLGNVMDACLPALNEAGIAVIQPILENELGRYVNTVFLHECGEKLECPVPLIVNKQDMQGLGSAITYARRYGLMSLAGIAPEDDDGNAAVKGAQEKEPKGWSETIIAELAPTATSAEKARAVTDALVRQWKRKRSAGELDNEWERREPDINRIKAFSAEMFGEIVDAFENRKQEVTNNYDKAAE